MLQPGESAVVWVATNTQYNESTDGEGNGVTFDAFKAALGLDADDKAFVA